MLTNTVIFILFIARWSLFVITIICTHGDINIIIIKCYLQYQIRWF